MGYMVSLYQRCSIPAIMERIFSMMSAASSFMLPRRLTDIRTQDLFSTAVISAVKISNIWSVSWRILTCSSTIRRSAISRISCPSCDNTECGLPVFRLKAGRTLSDDEIKDLLTEGHTKLLKGFKSKQGKSFDAVVAFDGEYNTTFVFPEAKKDKKFSGRKK